MIQWFHASMRQWFNCSSIQALNYSIISLVNYSIVQLFHYPFPQWFNDSSIQIFNYLIKSMKITSLIPVIPLVSLNTATRQTHHVIHNPEQKILFWRITHLEEFYPKKLVECRNWVSAGSDCLQWWNDIMTIMHILWSSIFRENTHWYTRSCLCLNSSSSSSSFCFGVV